MPWVLSELPLNWVLPCVVTSAFCVWLRSLHKHNQECLWKLRARLGQPGISGPPRDHLRVLSQNMWCTNSWGAVQKGSKGPEVRKRFDALVNAALEGDYDVLLLQELFIYRMAYFFMTVEEVVYLTERLEAAGYVYHSNLAYNVPVVLGQSSGLAIFSKHPFVEWGGHTFTTHSLKDSLNAKGFVHATVSIGRELFFFYSTHLDSSGRKPDVKKKQVDQVAKHVSRVLPSHTAIVAGDFNICSHTPGMRSLYTHLVLAMGGMDLAPVFTDHPVTHRSGRTLDHIFIGGGQYSVRDITFKTPVRFESGLPGIPVSDHNGLAVTLKLQSPIA
ncbi:uncharacterized protein LOC135826727 [Sycon ciliatum]|uniref:uncharacterized protein LOC135826727 n=1 Tax=Sycon ciliatum TaxID=27933 RepID=UPI0031F6F298|eukprot:scpid90369/ scgid23763/ 